MTNVSVPLLSPRALRGGDAPDVTLVNKHGDTESTERYIMEKAGCAGSRFAP
jgi:hypothetical protein